MVGKMDYSSVPTSVELENNSHNKKYTVNKEKNSHFLIPKSVCVLMAIGAFLLAVVASLAVFFLVPRCTHATSEALKVVKHEEIDERLPTHILPLHYRLEIIPDLDKRTTNGDVTITLKVLEETPNIIFHVKDIKINESSIQLKANGSDKSIQISSQEYLPSQQYRVSTKESLKKDTEYFLEIRFEGRLDHPLQGFYQGDYYDVYERNNKTVLATQFSPIDARRAFPCFDEPFFKSKFIISIARPSGINMTGLSNMPKIGQPDLITEKPGWEWDHYEETPIMSSYLVAFVLGHLNDYKSNFDKRFTLWTQKPLIYQSSYALEIAPKILSYFETYFKTKFPLDKIDIVALPQFGFQAMENWGLITFRESALLFDNYSSPLEKKSHIASVLSHELAHQWFGNLITPKWWNDLWIKEGFSSYFQYQAVNQAEPNWFYSDEFFNLELMKAFDADCIKTSRELRRHLKNNNEIRQIFDDISYSKGASIIRMMQHFLGENTFKNGLINFLEKYKYSSADNDDLFEVLNIEAQKNNVLDNFTVGEVMDGWVNRPGYPVLNAKMDYTNKKLTISQKRFLINDHSEEDLPWWVPISIATDTEPFFNISTPNTWLKNERSITISVNFDAWYTLNVNNTGYYMVNYDEENWKALTANIINLPPPTRAQLINDAMELAKAGLLDYDIPLRLTGRMARNDNNVWLVPTVTALKKLEFLSDMLSSTPIFGMFEKYHSTIFDKTYTLVKLEAQPFLDYRTEKIRTAVLKWSCRSSESVCAISSLSMFRNWIGRGEPIPANLRNIVYCTAIRDGGETEWQYAFDEYERTLSPIEKDVLLDALGCTSKQWLFSRHLNELVNSPSSIRIQDAARVFESIAKNKAGSPLAFDFLRKNWRALKEHLGDGFSIFSRLILSLSKYMSTEFQLSELQRFKEEMGQEIGASQYAMDTCIEIVKSKVEWMKKNYNSVEQWLIANKDIFHEL